MAILTLDPVEQALVELALARHRQAVAEADARLEEALTPLRDRYQLPRLDFNITDTGIQLRTPDAPVPPEDRDGAEL